jgi:hypothetical protein
MPKVYEPGYRKRLIKYGLIAGGVIFLIIACVVLNMSLRRSDSSEINIDVADTVKEVLEYYRCKYISEEKSQMEDVYVDINCVFIYPLFDGEVSNEEFFNNVIKDIARVLDYSSYRMIDETNDIEIVVYCKGSSIDRIVINGREDYFIYMKSQIELSKYELIPTTEFEVQSPEIQNLRENLWDSNVYIGERESIVNSYYQYFDEGYAARRISGKIYNIVFTTKYQGTVLNGLFPGVDFASVESKFGKPTFKDDTLNVIGYKGRDIYVFFTEDQISIYRVSQESTGDFLTLTDKFISGEYSLLEFMNQLTYLWPDYSEYTYSANGAFISYPLKGVDIKIGRDAESGIILYNNFNAEVALMKSYAENTEFILRLKIDDVFEAEKRRIEAEKDLIKTAQEYKEKLNESKNNIIGESLVYDVCPVYSGDDLLKLIFISKDGQHPNRELTDNIYTYAWFGSEAIIYSQLKKGIYYYNVNTGEKLTIQEDGESNFKIVGIEGNVLKYDKEEVIINY